MSSVKQTQGTTITWTSSGGDKVLTLTSLATATGRMGASNDFGATFPERVRVELTVDFNVAPTAGNVINVYWSSSQGGTNFDGECTGSDAAYSNTNDLRRLHWVGALSASNDTDLQRASWVFFLPARYGLPVVFNNSGQALTNVGTDQTVKVTPLIGDIA